MRAAVGFGVLLVLLASGCVASAPPDGTPRNSVVPTSSGASDESSAEANPSDTLPTPPVDAPMTIPSASTTTIPSASSTSASSTSASTTTNTTTTSTTTTSTTTTSTTTTIPAAVISASADLAALVVAEPDPTREPYERARYDGGGWLDVDGDCVSTRHELLASFSVDAPTSSADGCRVETGRWIDPFDGAEYTSEAQVSIDHLVPLAEAHRSGAWTWDDETKQRFSNDQTPGHLLVVGRDTNQAKADKRPDQWLPPDSAAHCQYAIDWIETKERYRLTITATEKVALAAALDSCSTSATTVRPDAEVPPPLVVVSTPTTTTTSTIAPSAGPGVVALLGCDKRSETVTIGNTGGESISLSGFVLHDEGAKHSTTLDGFGSLAPGQELRILTGPDASSGAGQVVWKRQNVWNNDGDTAHLIGLGVEQTKSC